MLYLRIRKLTEKNNKMNLGRLFLLLIFLCGETCRAQGKDEDSLFFCPQGYYKILKIDKVRSSKYKESFCDGLKSRDKSSLYMIFAEKTEDSLDVNHQDEHKVVRILSVREGGKTKGNMLKKNKVYFFNLVSLYWKTTELGDMLSHVNNEGFYYKGYYIHRLENEDIENIYEARQLEGLNYRVSGFSH